tara:strand:- start:59 stop:256 length:198 start_codon:yes stop_codon:yes gene_type:complete
MLKKSVITASVIALTLGLSACGGGGATVEARGTQGQQLMDLKEALDKGVITEKEFENAKEEILDS